MSCIGAKQRLRVKNYGILQISQQYDENKIEIYSEKEWEKMIDWICEISAPKDKKDFYGIWQQLRQTKKELLID